MIQTVIFDRKDLLFSEEQYHSRQVKANEPGRDCFCKAETQDLYEKENGVWMREGLKQFLSYLVTHGYRVALADDTNNSCEQELLKKADIKKYFDYLVLSNMIDRKMPDPNVFQIISQKSCTPLKNCLVMSCSSDGVRAAYAAGCHTVSVSESEIPDEMSEETVGSFSEALKAMKSLEN